MKYFYQKSILSSSENSKSLVSIAYYSKDKSYKFSQKDNPQKKNNEIKLGEMIFHNDNLNFAEEDLHVFK